MRTAWRSRWSSAQTFGKRTAAGVARPADIRQLYRTPTLVPKSHAWHSDGRDSHLGPRIRPTAGWGRRGPECFGPRVRAPQGPSSPGSRATVRARVCRVARIVALTVVRSRGIEAGIKGVPRTHRRRGGMAASASEPGSGHETAPRGVCMNIRNVSRRGHGYRLRRTSQDR
jgi:hypothetical protein